MQQYLLRKTRPYNNTKNLEKSKKHVKHSNNVIETKYQSIESTTSNTIFVLLYLYYLIIPTRMQVCREYIF